MITYRKATENDIDQLAILRVQQLMDEGYRQINSIDQDLRAYFSSSLENGSLICWLGIHEETIIATGAVCFYQLPPSFSNPTGRVAYITNMYTRDAFRKQGIASHLVERLISEAQNLGHTSVRLHASRDGKSIYERAGFVVSDGFMAKKL